MVGIFGFIHRALRYFTTRSRPSESKVIQTYPRHSLPEGTPAITHRNRSRRLVNHGRDNVEYTAKDIRRQALKKRRDHERHRSATSTHVPREIVDEIDDSLMDTTAAEALDATYTPPEPYRPLASDVLTEIQDDSENRWVEGQQQAEVPQTQTTTQSSEIHITSCRFVVETHHTSPQHTDIPGGRLPPSSRPDVAERREASPPLSRSPVRLGSPTDIHSATPTAVPPLLQISTSVAQTSPEGVNAPTSSSPVVSLPSPQSAIPGRSLEFLQPHTSFKGSYDIQFHQYFFRQEGQTPMLGETRWHYYRASYTFASPIGLHLCAPLRSGDIFLHENTATGELRAWVWVWGGLGWVAAQEGHQHPTNANRRLWFVDRKAREGEKTAPSWVTYRTFLAYRSGRRRAARKERACDGSEQAVQQKKMRMTKGVPVTAVMECS